MRMFIKSVFVDDQAKALTFYTEKLGFKKKNDLPLGDHRWLTVVSPEEENGVELLLEPNEHAAAAEFQRALVEDGIPCTAFCVDDIEAEFERLQTEGVAFTQPPMEAGEATIAVLDDTCGNLLQLVQLK